MYDMILIRYGEMTLKKSNYKQFLKRINLNIKNKIKDIPNIKFLNNDYRGYIYLNGTDYRQVTEKLDEVVGLHSYSLCKEVSKNIDDIAKWSIKAIEDSIARGTVKPPFTFKVETNRGDKQFPLTSVEISRQVAGKVLPSIKEMSVDVHNPDLTLSIDLRVEGAYIYTDQVKGLGGYPSGIAANGLVMISGGIDSPVATYLAMRKGITVSCIHFAAPPYTSQMALDKVKDLLATLTKYQYNAKIDLYVANLADIEVAIHEKCNNEYMVLLLRRAMYRVADRLCRDKGFKAIINGESVGQVASQTLEAMNVVNDVTNIPIIRPLCCMDKDEIVHIARTIKTFDISIRPYEDCCTVFVPEHPCLRPSLEYILKEEEKLDLDERINKILENIECIEIK